MRKKIILILAVVLCGCGANKNAPAETFVSETDVQTSTAAAEKVTEASTTADTSAAESETSIFEAAEKKEKDIIVTGTVSEVTADAKAESTGEHWQWVLEPTFEAKEIENIPRGYTYYGDPVYDTIWHSKYFYIEDDDGQKAVIDIDGNILSRQIFEDIYYCWYGCALYDENNRDEENPYKDYDWSPAGCILNDDGTLGEMEYISEVFQQTTNGTGKYFYNGDANWGTIVFMCDGISNNVYNGPAVTALQKIEIETDERGYRYAKDHTVYSKEGEYGLVVIDKLVTDFIYDDHGNFIDGIIPMKKDGKWGYLDRQGNTVIPFEYDAVWKHDYFYGSGKEKARDACEGYLVLYKDGEYALYTTDYEEVIPFGEFQHITSPFRGKMWAQNKDGLWGVIRIVN